MLRVIAGWIGRGVLLAFGLACLWYGAQLTGLGAAAYDAFDSFRLPHPFQDPASSEQVKLAAAGGVLDDLGTAFGVLALIIGTAAAFCAVFPWSRVLRRSSPSPRFAGRG